MICKLFKRTFWQYLLPAVILFLAVTILAGPGIRDIQNTYASVQDSGFVRLNDPSVPERDNPGACVSLLSGLPGSEDIDVFLDPAAECKAVKKTQNRDIVQVIREVAPNFAFVYTKKQGRDVLSRVYVLSSRGKMGGLDSSGNVAAEAGKLKRAGSGGNMGKQAFSDSPAPGKLEKKTTSEQPDYVPGEILVKFASGIEQRRIEEILQQVNYTGKNYMSGLGYYKVQLPEDMPVEKARKILSANREIEVAEPNYIMHAQYTPKDNRIEEQWALDKINATSAWERQKGSGNVTIAVVDTGVDYRHEDLGENIWNNTDEEIDGDDTDNNGKYDDIRGWDFVNGTNDPMDKEGHGTLVSGVAGAVGNNSKGIAGVAFNCSVMAIRAGYNKNGDTVLPSDLVANGTMYAYKNGADVINLSLGSDIKSSIIEQAIDNAIANGSVVVAAAGNNNSSAKFYPAALDKDALISVGSTNREDKKSSFSNYGDWVDLSAPGNYVLTTNASGEYVNASGTSMSVPQVSGAAALVVSEHPRLSNDEVKQVILQTVDELDSLQDYNLTSGRLDAGKAVQGKNAEPVITFLDPEELHQGDKLEVGGFAFGANATQSSLFLGDRDLQVVDWNNTRIKCNIPLDAQTGDVYVSTSEGSSNKVELKVLQRFYTETETILSSPEQTETTGWFGDDAHFFYELPFSFPFFGREFGSVVVSTNGYLNFLDESMSFDNSRRELSENVAIAPFWADLHVENATSQGIGVFENSTRIVFQWSGIEFNNTESRVDFEAALYSDGGIDFRYQEIDVEDGLQPTIGISGGEKGSYHISSYSGNASINGTSTRFVPEKDYPAWNQDFAPSPAKIFGSVEINGEKLEPASEGYSFEVSRNGSRINSDQNGLNAQGYYLLRVPVYDSSTNTDGIKPGSTLQLEVYQDSRISVLQPDQGEFQLQKLQKIDIEAKQNDSGGGGGCAMLTEGEVGLGKGLAFVLGCLFLIRLFRSSSPFVKSRAVKNKP